jgi:hypothetical protein
MARQNKVLQDELEPKRMEYARRGIQRLGYIITFENQTELRFEYKGNVIKFYPYSGWHTGKGIKDGRGIDNLLKQL